MSNTTFASVLANKKANQVEAKAKLQTQYAQDEVTAKKFKSEDKAKIATKIIEVLSGDGGANIALQKAKIGLNLDNTYLGLSSKSHQTINPIKDSDRWLNYGSGDGLGRDALLGEELLWEEDENGQTPVEEIKTWVMLANVVFNIITAGGGTSTSFGKTVNEIVNLINEEVDTTANTLEQGGSRGAAVRLRLDRKLSINLVTLPYESDRDSRCLANLNYLHQTIFKSSNYMIFDYDTIAKHSAEDNNTILPRLVQAQVKVRIVFEKLYTYQAEEGKMAIDKSDLDSIFQAKGKCIFYAAGGNSVEEAYSNAFNEIRKFDENANDKFVQNAMIIFEYRNANLRTAKAISEEVAIKKSILQNAGSQSFVKPLDCVNPNITLDVIVTFALTGINTDKRSDNQEPENDSAEKAYSQALATNANIYSELGNTSFKPTQEVSNQAITPKLNSRQAGRLGGIKTNNPEIYDEVKTQLLNKTTESDEEIIARVKAKYVREPRDSDFDQDNN